MGVHLFNRQPNKITLTKTGRLAVQKANKLLAANRQFVTEIQDFAQNQRILKVASTAPGPLILLKRQQNQKNSSYQVEENLLTEDEVTGNLTNHRYSLIITNHELQSSLIESRYLGQEQLFVNLDQFMYLANQRQVQFKELSGLSFVVLSAIGPWKEIIQKEIPDAKFLYQNEYAALSELTRYTNFPFFTTNITDPNETYDTTEVPYNC